MASFNGNIDLLSLNGAKVFTGIDQKIPNRAYICVPVDLNDIRIQASLNDASKQMATLRVGIWPFSEKYKQKVRKSNAERGDNDKAIPTHEMQMSFSSDYIKSAIKAYPALVQQVKDANVSHNPDIVNQDPLDENTHLYKAIRIRMNRRIASLYQNQQQTAQQPAYPQPFAQASAPTAYVAPAEGTDNIDPAVYADPNCELPF